MQLPIPGDLISIDKPISAILVGGDLHAGKTWSYSLISIESNHTGLVLEAYNPKNFEREEVLKAANELLKAQSKRSKGEKPEQITIIVMTIGTNIVEAVYDPAFMTILSL